MIYITYHLYLCTALNVPFARTNGPLAVPARVASDSVHGVAQIPKKLRLGTARDAPRPVIVVVAFLVVVTCVMVPRTDAAPDVREALCLQPPLQRRSPTTNLCNRPRTTDVTV